ncbi:MAG: DoxX family protein [Gemmatimonadota bacterium]
MRFKTSAGTGLLVLRVAVGLVFLMHGWTKMFGMQISFVQEMLAMVGWVLPAWLLSVVAWLELVGGLALVSGIFTRPFALLLGVEMIVAVILFHARQGFFIASVPNAPLAYGFEYHITLIAGLACLALAGPGAWSLDKWSVEKWRSD